MSGGISSAILHTDEYIDWNKYTGMRIYSLLVSVHNVDRLETSVAYKSMGWDIFLERPL